MPLFNLVSTRTRTNDPTMTHQYLNESKKKNTKEKLTRKKSHDEILKERKMMKGTKKY